MEKYVSPEMEIIEIEAEDIVRTSDTSDNTGSFDGEWAPIPW